MSWILSIWAAGTLLALCWGQTTEHEGIKLSPSGYHLCIHNETRIVSFSVVHPVPYTVTKSCGGWLFWITCPVTLCKMTHQVEYKAVEEQVTRCCDGYEQVGRYCALSVNRSDEFTAKPGSCPSADGPSPRSEDCEFDLDCPGWQKCCQRSGRLLCSHPARSESDFVNRRTHWNVTVTVKTDYQELLSTENGLLNLTRVLQALVTGALESEVPIFYLHSWPVHPYRTATSLLINCSSTPSSYKVTSKLHLLLRHIPEVTSVTVEDVDECAQPTLHQCSPHADCNNTSGSYLCVCHQGYVDVDPSSPGVHCSGEFGASNTSKPLLTHPPVMNSTFISTQEPPGISTTGISISSETSVAAALSNTTSVTYNSAHALLGTSTAPHTSMMSATDSPLPATTCLPVSIRNLLIVNITGTSISVSWSSQIKDNQTFQVTLSKASQVVDYSETTETTVEIRGLQPGVLYDVTVTPYACEQQGVPLHTLVRTDAQTVEATARLTNIEFTAALRNASSQAYRNLSESFIQEIYQSLSPEIRALVDSGEVRIEIRGFSLGSVVVNFTIIFSQSQSQAMSNITTTLVHSLMDSSKFTVDPNNTSISDFDECASGENDCSPLATCTNTWTSFTCACLIGFIDYSPDRPGRTCQANVTSHATAEPSALFSTLSTTDPAINAVTRQVFTINSTDSQVTRFQSPTNSSTPVQTASAITAPTTTTSPTFPTDTITTPATTSARAGIMLSIHPAAPDATPVTAAPPTTVTTMTASSTISTTTTAASSTTPTSTSAALRSALNASMSEALSVQCRVAAITVTIAKDFLQNANIQESALYLGMQGCGVNGGNATHVQLTVAWNECDTRLVHNETFYTACVTLFNSMDPYASLNGLVEVPRIQLEVPIMCSFMKSRLISADFGSLGHDVIKDVITGLGSFQVTVQLMNGVVPLQHNYSLYPEQALVVEVSLNTTSEQIKVVLDKCWATPTQNPADTYSYTFLENSCPMNMYTKVLLNGNSTTSRVSVQIFSFVNLNVIYLHCQVQICVLIGSDGCVPSCLQRAARSSNSIGTALASSGPVQRLNGVPTEFLEEKFDTLHIVGLSILGIGLSLFFIIGFVCVFYYQRNRIGNYNFGVKPKEENFTYLAFNT